jgi:hypothetical protein
MPKVMEALWVWRQYPRQIASDLSQYHHRRIAEWHRGDMSSYELLELLEFMPDRGAFKKAVRGNEWSEEEAIWAQVANELAILRAVQAPKVKGERYGSRLWFSPAKLREMAAEAEEQEELRESVYQFARGKKGKKKRKFSLVDEDEKTENDDDFDDAESIRGAMQKAGV